MSSPYRQSTPFLSVQGGGKALSHFNTFVQNSGLRQLAADLSLYGDSNAGSGRNSGPQTGTPNVNYDVVSTSTHQDRDVNIDVESNARPTSRDALDTMDESYKSFKNSYLDLMAQIHESTEREQKLLNGNKELERKLAVIEVELVAERDKVKVTAREAAEWKAKYEDLKSTLKSALGQHK